MNHPENHPAPRPPSIRGNARVIQLVIIVVVVAVVALPVALISYAKTQQRNRLLGAVQTEMETSNRLRQDLKAAYDKVGKTRRLPGAEASRYRYEKEFTALFRRYYEARSAQQTDETPPSMEELTALERDFEQFRRRLASHYRRLSALQELVEHGEKAVKLGIWYQRFIGAVRDVAPYGENQHVLLQLEEADRRIKTGTDWVLSGVQKYLEDLKGEGTPVLIKSGIKQIRDVTRDVNTLLSRLRGTEGAKVKDPNAADATLAEFIQKFLRDAAKHAWPDIPEGGQGK